MVPDFVIPLAGLALAICVETPIVVTSASGAANVRARAGWAAIAIGANCISYFPFLAALAGLRGSFGDIAALSILECLVFVLEGAIYALVGGLTFRRGLAVAAVANAASFAAGEVMGLCR